MNDLNIYGDSFRPTEDFRGVDISSQRMDELDLRSLGLISNLKEIYQHSASIIDLGGGFGAHSVRMAECGASVTMFDISDTAQKIFDEAKEKNKNLYNNICFVKKDFENIVDEDLPDSIDILYSQRAIHYIPYNSALHLIDKIFRKMKTGSQIFISAAGYDTEYGLTYPDRSKPVEQRYNFVTPDMQEKHGIHHKIVTYSENDMVNLLTGIGFENLEVSSSAFGNIKAIGVKP